MVKKPRESGIPYTHIYIYVYVLRVVHQFVKSDFYPSFQDFIFVFQQFDCDIPKSGSPCVYLAELLTFISTLVFHQFGENLNHCIFKYFLFLNFFCSYARIILTHILDSLMLSHRSLRFWSFLIFLI